MYLFFLGVILGMGLTLAIRSVDRTLRIRRANKELEFHNAVQAAAMHLQESWSQNVDPFGWGSPSSSSNGFQPIRHP